MPSRGDGHALAHAGVARQHRLDLPQLDAEAADLHLVVDAAEELHLPSGSGARRSPVR